MTAEQVATQNARVARHRGKVLLNSELVETANGAAPARSKMGNEKCSHDGIDFDSIGEGARYIELKLLQAAGQISDLRWQVPFSLQVNGEHVGKYVADFTYRERGIRTVEDFKGFQTELYKLKRALMRAVYNITIKETGR